MHTSSSQLRNHIGRVPLIFVLMWLALCDLETVRAQSEDAVLVRELTLDGDSIGSDEYDLSFVTGMTVGKNGSIFVALRSEQCVRVFDQHGRFVTDIGRGGAGPGEFRLPAALGWRADSLWVFDMALGRFSLFRIDGAFIRSWQMTGPGLYTLAKGGALKLTLPLGLRNGSYQVALVFESSPIGATDTIAFLPDPTREMTFTVQTGNGTITALNPFATPAYWKVAPDGASVATVHMAPEHRAYVVTKISVDGDTLVSRHFPFEPQPITARARQGAMSTVMTDLLRSSRRTIPTESRILEALGMPEYLPPVSQLTVGSDHTIWLRREDRGEPTTTWQVLNATGETSRLVSAPRVSHLWVVSEDTAWGIEEDHLGVPHVCRYRIVNTEGENKAGTSTRPKTD